MLIKEYSNYIDSLICHSKSFIQNSCRLTGSLDRLFAEDLDPHFIYDYRCYAFTKSTKSMIAIRSLLEIGNYEDVFILSRTILECYLASRYLDENFDVQVVRGMVLIPTAVSKGVVNRANGQVVDRNTQKILFDDIMVDPKDLSLGKDRSYFYDLYDFLCQNTHCNIGQVYAFLDDNHHFQLYSEENTELAHLISLFVFSKIFENSVLLESTKFPSEKEERECEELLIELTKFLYRKLRNISEEWTCGIEKTDKAVRALAKKMSNSFTEQLGRVEKEFVDTLARENIETRRESNLKPILLENEKPSEYFLAIRQKRKLWQKYPELVKLVGVEQDPVYHPEGDVWTHTMQVLDRAAKLRDKVSDPYAFMLLALTHDMGKPATTTKENGRIRSIGHEIEGVRPAKEFLENLTNNVAAIDYVLKMIPMHMKPILYAHDRSSVKATDRMFQEAYAPHDLILFAAADKGMEPDDEDLLFLEERYRLFREGHPDL